MTNSCDSHKPPTDEFLLLLKRYDSCEVVSNTRGRDDRYEYAIVRDGSKKLFIKRTLEGTYVAGLQRELKWAHFMEFVQSKPHAWLRGPTGLSLLDERTLAMDYIEAPHLADYHSIESWTAQLPKYAQMLHELDIASGEWQDDTIPNTKRRSERVVEIWDDWLGENTRHVPRYNEARHRMLELSSQASCRMQHGDLRPWQIFTDGEQWIIYDGEASGSDLFRYNDLAYGYGRLYANLRSAATARRLLHTFLDCSQQPLDNFLPEFIPVMLGRAMSMVSDSLNDVAKTDYRAEALDLLDICLDSPEKLIDNT